MMCFVPRYTFHSRKNDLFFNFSIFSARKVILVGLREKKKGKTLRKNWEKNGEKNIDTYFYNEPIHTIQR